MVAMLTEPLTWWVLGFIVVLATLVLVVASLDAGPKPGNTRLQQWRQWREQRTAQRLPAAALAIDVPPKIQPTATAPLARLTLAKDQSILGAIECPVEQLCERTLGRSNTLCDQVINASTVSRCHARLVWEPQKACWYVEDLGSKNGTYLDGAALRPYTPVPLSHQARLTLGGLELIVTTGTDSRRGQETDAEPAGAAQAAGGGVQDLIRYHCSQQ